MKYICTGDIHLGHSKTPTEHIINSFKKCILTSLNKDINVLFIAGDLFDRLLDFNSIEVHQSISFFNILLNYCSNNNIKLRVLEGTPSHDWQQSNILMKLNDIRSVKCDLRYFKTLDIEYMSEYNKHILYIPDEWTKNHVELETQIQAKLNECKIKQVDIAILHGQFRYQLLSHIQAFHFKEDYFLKIVKDFVFINHYHVHSVYDRIIAPGSLERLCHGEEQEKGFILVDNNTFNFIPNHNSYIYKTIKISNSFTIEKLDKIISKYPINSYIRLIVLPDHDFNVNFDKLKIRYLDYNLKKITNDNVSESNSATYIVLEDIESIDSLITNSNISSLILTSILNNNTLTELEINKVNSYLTIFEDMKEDENEEQLT
ncbi:MAG: hypothetical protein ACD_33C00025G0002 [uncultured bacterium]|nr:MAG: hypothetical protein ACD_33C00025G0002 [uncultured bacterium]